MVGGRTRHLSFRIEDRHRRRFRKPHHAQVAQHIQTDVQPTPCFTVLTGTPILKANAGGVPGKGYGTSRQRVRSVSCLFGRSMKRSTVLIAIVIVCVSFGVYLHLLADLRSNRSVLSVHVGTPWRHVSVSSPNFSGVKSFHSGAPVTLSPIGHGTYTVEVEFADGRTVWTEFFHYDAGVRKRIDLYFDGATSGTIGIRETMNDGQVLFEGQATPEATSAQKPYRLDWI